MVRGSRKRGGTRGTDSSDNIHESQGVTYSTGEMVNDVALTWSSNLGWGPVVRYIDAEYVVTWNRHSLVWDLYFH